MLHQLHHDRNYIASLEADRLRDAKASDLERVMRAAGKGDASAWSALVARFRGNVMRVARSYGLNAHAADDVAQETLLRLYRNLDSVRDPQALGAWLNTTARRESLRALKGQRREEPTDEELGVAVAEVAGDDDLAERQAGFARALALLTPRQRELMDALLADPAPSYAELSAQLGIPIGSIGPTRGRCVKRLRRALAPELI